MGVYCVYCENENLTNCKSFACGLDQQTMCDNSETKKWKITDHNYTGYVPTGETYHLRALTITGWKLKYDCKLLPRICFLLTSPVYSSQWTKPCSIYNSVTHVYIYCIVSHDINRTLCFRKCVFVLSTVGNDNITVYVLKRMFFLFKNNFTLNLHLSSKGASVLFDFFLLRYVQCQQHF